MSFPEYLPGCSVLVAAYATTATREAQQKKRQALHFMCVKEEEVVVNHKTWGKS